MSRWTSAGNWERFLYTGPVATERVEGLDFSSASNTNYMFSWSLNKLRHLRIVNLGKGPATTYDFSPLSKWGDNDAANPDALKSLVDTLLTDSYDRASAGMPAATVRLSSAVRSRLTEEQKAAITAKGFTITS